MGLSEKLGKFHLLFVRYDTDGTYILGGVPHSPQRNGIMGRMRDTDECCLAWGGGGVGLGPFFILKKFQLWGQHRSI